MLRNPWETIANFESYELLRKMHGEKHGGKGPNVERSRDISASFVQARQYFDSAKSADRSVKPLLLYYGVASLSRGLVLYLTDKPFAENLTKGHGLSECQWHDVFPIDKQDHHPDISNLEIQVNQSGTFVEFLEAIRNRNLLRAAYSGVNWKSDLGIIPPNARFSLGDLMARLPDISEQYAKWKEPLAIKTARNNRDRSKTIFFVSRQPDFVNERLIKDILGTHLLEDLRSSDHFFVCNVNWPDVKRQITDRINERQSGIGEIYFMKEYPNSFCLAKGPQIFAISFILGMLVRYHPGAWMNIIQQRVGDAGLPSIQKTIEVIEGLFPRIVVDFLEE